MTGSPYPAESELKGWLEDIWFMVELNCKIQGVSTLEYISGAVQLRMDMERSGILQHLNRRSRPIAIEPPQEIRLNGIVLTVKGKDDELTPTMIEKMRDELKKKGITFSYEELVFKIEKLKTNKYVTNNEKGFNDAVDAIFRTIIKYYRKDCNPINWVKK